LITANYAFGIRNDKYRGFQIYEHGGIQGGFKTQMIVFPELKMGFVVLGNFHDFPNKEKAFELADLFIKKTDNKKIESKTEKMDSSIAILTNRHDYLKYTGNYMDEQGIAYKILIHDNKMYLHFQDEIFLLNVKKLTAFPITMPDQKFIFEAKKSNDTLLIQEWPGGRRVLRKYKGIETYPISELQNYVGTHYSPELDCRYKIILRNHELIMTHNKYEDNRLELIGSEDLFSQNYWWMAHLKMLRNENNQIDGFEVYTDRIMHLRFIKEK
jgi:hypothetical protein